MYVEEKGLCIYTLSLPSISFAFRPLNFPSLSFLFDLLTCLIPLHLTISACMMINRDRITTKKSNFKSFTAISPTTPSTEEEIESEKREVKFEWYEQWYPVCAECDLDKRRPHAKKVMGIDLVVWWDKIENAWKVFEDSFPYRMAPLSEGRIDQWGRLQCVYHGWCFGGAGDCKFIPQAPRDGPPVHTSKKACVAVYPSYVQNCLIWFWPNSDPLYKDIHLTKKPHFIPEYDHFKGDFTAFDLFRADREGERPLEISVPKVDVNGFTAKQIFGENYFIAPCIFYGHYTPSGDDQSMDGKEDVGGSPPAPMILPHAPSDKKSMLVFYCVPVSPGRSRSLSSSYGGKKLRDVGPLNWHKACYVPTKADAFSVAFRRWLNKYWTHTVSCSSCSIAYKRLSVLKTALEVISVASVGVVAAAKQGAMSVAASLFLNPTPSRLSQIEDQGHCGSCCAFGAELRPPISVSFVVFQSNNVTFNLTPELIHQFKECAQKFVVEFTSSLCLDVPTRWNSTYLMLCSGIKYRHVFDMLQFEDLNCTQCPTEEEWVRGEVMCRFLKPFYNITTLISGSTFPTSNLYFMEIWKIASLLNKMSEYQDAVDKSMALKMKLKFDKYWKEYSEILSVGAVLDPRMKFKVLDYFYSRIDHLTSKDKILKLKMKLYALYDEYKKRGVEYLYLKFLKLVVEVLVLKSGNLNSWVKKYVRIKQVQLLKQSHRWMFIWRKVIWLKMVSLIYSSWRDNASRFGELSTMACDVLSIPITTVASESSFSIGAYVLNKYRNRLLPEKVQALICLRNWLRGYSNDDEDYELDAKDPVDASNVIDVEERHSNA
ncbi:hypothetical protein SASPL_104796 [Salvia splendens]|uniref:Rieske domain-containing protein n=1 Tax=Salvia splendens TaxID=180675 RepID=A0A8X8YPA3_SALSN|nr:hypothetical protein SASPL_104796 [Salvia splendens]